MLLVWWVAIFIASLSAGVFVAPLISIAAVEVAAAIATGSAFVLACADAGPRGPRYALDTGEPKTSCAGP